MAKDIRGGEDMGVYSDYLDKQFSFEELSNERKQQLQRISSIRNRDIIVYASNIMLMHQIVLIIRIFYLFLINYLI